MKPYLVLYATREGHTERIGQHLLEVLWKRGLAANLEGAGHLPEGFKLDDYHGVIIAASVHAHKHEAEITRFVTRYREELEKMPTVFLSVSLSEAGAEDAEAPAERRLQAAADAQGMIDAFLEETKWHPSKIKAVAGALLYSRYNFLLRLVMKRIASKAGGDTDTSRDYDYTDWAALDRLVDELVDVKAVVGEAKSASL
jgi:menaquinone-dependent protoporphyrinogen oxidase